MEPMNRLAAGSLAFAFASLLPGGPLPGPALAADDPTSVDWVADDAICRCRVGNACWHYLHSPVDPPADPCWCNFCTKVSRHDGTTPLPEDWSATCAVNGKMECFLKRHAASWGLACSECLAKEGCACKNPHPADCPRCEKGGTPWDADRRKEVEARLAKEQEIFATRDVVVVLSPHFYVVTDIPSLKIRTQSGVYRVASGHELAHIYAERCEKARRDFVQAFGDELLMSVPSAVYLPKREKTAERIQAKNFASARTNLLYGGGGAGGRLAEGLCGNGFCLSLSKHGGDDEGLHHGVRHMVGHLCISTWVRGNPEERTLPPWMFEGAAHWLAKKHPLLKDLVVWCASEGNSISGSGKDWDQEARKSAGDIKLDPIEKFLDKSTPEQLTFEDHVRAWSYFDVSLREDRARFLEILKGLRNEKSSRQAWLEGASCTPEQWDRRWRERLLGRRPSMGEIAADRDRDKEEGPGSALRKALKGETDMETLAARVRSIGLCEDPRTAEVLVDLFARDSDRVRETLSVLLTKTTNPEVAKAMRDHGLASTVPMVRAYTARVLGLANDTASVEALRPLAADKEWFVRAEVALALMRLKDPRLVDDVGPLASDPAAKTRIAAMDALASAGSAAEKVLSKVTANLDHPAWQVRSAAAESLAGIGSMGSVEALIQRMVTEAGRVRVDVHAALKAVTRNDLGLNPENWVKWWKKERERVGGGVPGRPQAPPAENPEDQRYAVKERMYGIHVFEERVGYVLDMSSSMHILFTPDPESVKRLRRKYEGSSKFEISKEEIVQSIDGLNPAAKFTVIAFADEARFLSRTLLPASPDNREKADAFLKSCRIPPPTTNTGGGLGGGGGLRKGRPAPPAAPPPPMTNFYCAFQAVLDIPTGGIPGPDFHDTADTIFFLTDGQPTKGEITDADVLLAWFDGLNRYARIRVHVVAYGSVGIDIPYLTHLAQDNGGKFIHILEAPAPQEPPSTTPK